MSTPPAELQKLQESFDTAGKELAPAEQDLSKIKDSYAEEKIGFQSDLDTYDLMQHTEKAVPMPEITQWEQSKEYQSAKLGKAGIGMAFALFVGTLVGSMAMRTGAKGALSALTAAMQGWKEGDKEKWANARSDYDRHVKFIEHGHQKMMADLHKLEQDKRLSFHEMMTQKRLILLRHGVEVDKAQEHVDKIIKAQQNAYLKIMEMSTRGQVAAKKKAASGKGPTAASLEEAAYQEAKKADPTLTRDAHHQAYKSNKKGGFSFVKPAGSVTVTDPNGKVHTFPDQKSADEFKKAAGIK